MQITYQDFCRFLKPGGFHKHGMHAIPTVHQKAVKHYCGVLTVRSACSGDCATCIQTVRGLLNTAKFSPDIRAYALYTFILKQAATQVIEQARETQKSAPVQTPFYEEEGDALDILLETLNA